MATGRLPDPNTAPLTAKGDLYTYSTVPARLAVGNNGDTLVADSSQTTGLRYNPPVGSLANPVINGGFDVWQRGTSFTDGNGTTFYGADRWRIYSTTSGRTWSRQTVSDTTNLPNIQYCQRVARNSGNTATNIIYTIQDVETVNSIPYAGKTVTLSFYARAGANFSAASSALAVQLTTGTGTDQSSLSGFTGSANPISSSVTLTTTWQRFALTGTIASTATQLSFNFNFTPVGTAGANDWFEITGVQLDVGTWTASTAPTFRRSGGTLAGELAACQRYYFRSLTGSDTFMPVATGVQLSATDFYGFTNLPTQMRLRPQSVDFSTLQLIDGNSGTYTVTNVTLVANQCSPTLALAIYTMAGGTIGRSGWVRSNNNTAGYVGFSAEL